MYKFSHGKIIERSSKSESSSDLVRSLGDLGCQLAYAAQQRLPVALCKAQAIYSLDIFHRCRTMTELITIDLE
ncbi:MAG: hypothetical protein AAGE84_26485 [Cyanobacteria bacterium P01_G01_bin.39]